MSGVHRVEDQIQKDLHHLVSDDAQLGQPRLEGSRHAAELFDLGEVHAGGWVGEMSMLLDEPRSATVRAQESGTELVVISQQNFETILRENPKIVHAILREMAVRVKATTARVV